MKLNKFLVLVALALPLVFVSCSDDDDEGTSAEAGKYDFKVDGIYYNIVSETNRTVEVTDNESGLRTTMGYASYSGSVSIPITVTHNGVTYTVVGIKDYAFGDSRNLTSVTIPNSVTYIGEAAFNTTGLTSVTIPNSVETIGRQAFDGCTSLSSVSLSNSLTILAEGIFMNCSSLTSVSIPNSVTNINDNAFRYCISLKDVTIPNSVTTLGASCFAECSALTEVIIGSSVDKIKGGAFRACNSMNKITSLNPTPPSCDVFSFYRDGDENKDIYNSVVYVPAGSKEAYSTADGWQEFSNIIEME